MFASFTRVGARSALRPANYTPSPVLRAWFPLFDPNSSARFIVTKRYTKEHEWVSLDSDTSVATISITQHASASLGDVVFVELPQIGKDIKAGDQIGAVESVKAAADIYAPVSGVVEEVNTKLGGKPSLLNQSPGDEGWLCKVKVTNPSEIEALMSEDAYKAFCDS